MYLIDWQAVVLVLAIVIAGIAIILEVENRRKLTESFDEMERYLEKYLSDKIDEKLEKSKEIFSKAQSSADALVQKQHNELLQHLISLTKSTGESKEEKDALPRYRIDPQFYNQIAQMIAQRVLEEIKKKW